MPTTRNPTSYADALQMAEALRAATATGPDPLTVVHAMSEATAQARDRSVELAKSGIRALWRMVDPYDDAAVKRFAQQAAPLLAVARAAAGRVAAAAMIRQLIALGVPARDAAPSLPDNVRAAAVEFTDKSVKLIRRATKIDYANGAHATTSRAGAANTQVLERVAKVYRFHAAQDSPLAEQLANDRIDDIVDTDVMLAQRLAAQEVLNKVDLDHRGKPDGSPIVGYRRVIHPELSRGGTCGMCVAAAHKKYTTSELMPIHANCHCTIAPITKTHDPGDLANSIDSNALYEAAGGNTAAHLKRTRYKVLEHGELGAVLVPDKPYNPRNDKSKRIAGGKRSTPPAAKPKPETPADIARRQVPIFKQKLAEMLDDGVPEDSPKVAHMRRMIDKFGKDLPDDSSPAKKTTKPNRRDGNSDHRAAAALKRPTDVEFAKHQIRTLEDNLTRLRDRGLDEDSEPVDYHKRMIDKFRRDVETAEGHSGKEPPTTPPTGEQSVHSGDDEQQGLGPLTPRNAVTKPVENYRHSGKLGRATSQRRAAPTPDELLKSTRVAPADGTDAQLDQYYSRSDERELAQLLRDRYGLRLRSIEERNTNGLKTPDSMTADDQCVELKHASGQRAIEGHLRKAMRQSDVVVIDARTMSRESAVDGLRDALLKYGAHYREILLVLSNGRAIRWRHGR